MSGGTLIVGASQAGVQVAVSLREGGDTGPITMIGAETHPPYQRPPLSKAFLAGTADLASLAFRTPAFYADRDITVLSGERVEQLRLRPGSAITDRGRSLPFDRLALTVGARARRLAVPGADLDGVCYLRDLDDAVSLRERLASVGNVVVVGGGFIGLEAAAVARSLGKTVTVIEVADRLMARVVSPVVSECYRQAHLRRGTGIRLGVGVAGFAAEEGLVRAVELSDGTRLPADLVLAGVGIEPRTELAAQLGLDCDGGIVVDEFARTSEPGVVAAGDCTVSPDPATGRRRVRLESVQHAIGQAKVAAASLLGRPESYRAVPWFWSDQYDLKLQIAGLGAGHDDHVVRGDPSSERFSVLYYRDGALVAVDAVNNAADYLAVRKALAQGVSIAPERALDTAVPLKTLVSRSG
ncbi:FAD-dependent oxidoreductase [Amycolatopsis sp. GM8]|uniref:NAD(P)/FAD-dependent oxidoreductase n=1 Tax=Amycolatopsis sp. GM8 TaxID=2896530 RepID=UPI001F3C5567|nr:FAD-dependent oxidoreductase [Amycolatopsis sp. GM8]